jgi:hypothetical protein
VNARLPANRIDLACWRLKWCSLLTRLYNRGHHSFETLIPHP